MPTGGRPDAAIQEDADEEGRVRPTLDLRNPGLLFLAGDACVRLRNPG